MNENPYSPPKDAPHTTLVSESAKLPRDILLTGSMSIRDVLRTQILILRRRWLYAVLTLGTYIAFVLVLGLFSTDSSLFGNTFMFLGLIVMPAILPLTLFMIFLRLRRDSKLKIGVFAATETRLANDGIHTSMTSTDMTIPWSSFSRYLASEHVVLLFLEESHDHLIVARSKLVHKTDWSVLLDFLHTRFPNA